MQLKPIVDLAGKMIVLVAVLILGTGASPKNSNPASISKASIKVKFLGGDNDVLKFNVKYESKTNSNFRLVAISEEGEVWFEESFQVKGDFNRRLTIPRLTAADYLTFLLKSPKEVKDLMYKVKIPMKVGDK